MTGWISVHRKIREHWMWKEKPFDKRSAWLDILLRVNHESKKVPIGNRIIDVKEGQTIWSIKDMANTWGWSRKKVDDFLKLLEKDNTLSTKRTSKYTLITVENWTFYQQRGTSKEHQNEQQKKHQKSTNNNNNNNNKYINSDFEELWKLYPVKKGKASVTDTQKKKLHSIGLEEMTRAINRYVKEQEAEKTERKYWKHGSTFFNSGYIDYLDANYEDKPQESTGLRRIEIR